MQAIADQLRESLPCCDEDVLHDDLAFWDAMRGFDCLDGAESSFIRVYAHAPSVSQTLEDWKDTLGTERAVVRGRNWYVIGPPSVLGKLDSAPDAPAIAEDAGLAVELTAKQDYLTTCVRFVASEGTAYIERPGKRSGSAKQYEALFPGVAAELRAAINDLGLERISEIPDTERWTAALSAVGPRLKRTCGAAYEKVGTTVQPLEGQG
jgi:hypothetical protein